MHMIDIKFIATQLLKGDKSHYAYGIWKNNKNRSGKLPLKETRRRNLFWVFLITYHEHKLLFYLLSLSTMLGITIENIPFYTAFM